MATTIQVVVDEKLKKDLKAMAKAEKRTLSNMAAFLIAMGALYYEQQKAKVEAA